MLDIFDQINDFSLSLLLHEICLRDWFLSYSLVVEEKKKKKSRIVDEIYAILLCLLINFSIIGVRLSLPVLTVSRIEFFFSLFFLYSFEYLIRENIEWFNCDF